ncbi:MAG: alpha/beta fold hydrolase [Dokdonella sp.]
MSEHVILLHGIWMRGISLLPLAHRLRDAGFVVQAFDYASVTGRNATAGHRLAERMLATGADRVHLVGHSLGGLLALNTLSKIDGLPDGRIVCLGSPLLGSDAARSIVRVPGARYLLGYSGKVLLQGLSQWQGTRSVGVIAGARALGLGGMVGHLSKPHDGTVSVAETRLPGIADHCVVNASHTGLLISAEVAGLTAGFLHQGMFPRTGES